MTTNTKLSIWTQWRIFSASLVPALVLTLSLSLSLVLVTKDILRCVGNIWLVKHDITHELCKFFNELWERTWQDRQENWCFFQNANDDNVAEAALYSIWQITSSHFRSRTFSPSLAFSFKLFCLLGSTWTKYGYWITFIRHKFGHWWFDKMLTARTRKEAKLIKRVLFGIKFKVEIVFGGSPRKKGGILIYTAPNQIFASPSKNQVNESKDSRRDKENWLGEK